MQLPAVRIAALLAAAALGGQPLVAPPPLVAAAPPEVARILGPRLPHPLVIRGGARRRVTLVPHGNDPSGWVAQVAAALAGRWWLELRAGPGIPGPEGTPPAGALQRSLTLGLQDLPAPRAFRLLAEQLEARLVLTGELPARVSLLAVNVPAQAVLDRIAAQAGAVWSLEYRIEAPDAPAVSIPATAPAPAPPPATAPRLADPRPVPPPISTSAVLPPAPGFRVALRAALARALQAGPDQRAPAVAATVRASEALLAAVAALPDADQVQRLREAAPVVASWRRLYRGLIPEVRRQLRPISALLDRWWPPASLAARGGSSRS